VLCIAYGYFVEPYWPAVTHVQITSGNLPPGSSPIRIAHISDLHSDARPRLEERLPDIISAEKPDLIVFTGDAVNSPDALPVMQRCMTRLAAIAPTFAVKGNWDAWYWGRLNLFDGTGVEELNGTAREVKAGTSSIWVAGVAVESEDRLNQAFKSIPPGACTLFLYHYPDLIREVAERPVDLYCAGHTHGGQVALPFYGALITFSRFGKRYESGLYRVNNTWMYVNRGIGMEGGSAPRVRFCARPEITVIEIHPEEGRVSRSGLRVSRS
jgi:predicted MPP superfamily phosphohydrolase